MQEKRKKGNSFGFVSSQPINIDETIGSKYGTYGYSRILPNLSGLDYIVISPIYWAYSYNAESSTKIRNELEVSWSYNNGYAVSFTVNTVLVKITNSRNYY